MIERIVMNNLGITRKSLEHMDTEGNHWEIKFRILKRNTNSGEAANYANASEYNLLSKTKNEITYNFR